VVFIAAVLAGIELIFSCNATGGAAFYLCMHDAELLVRRAVETSISCVNGRRRRRHVVVVGFRWKQMRARRIMQEWTLFVRQLERNLRR